MPQEGKRGRRGKKAGGVGGGRKVGYDKGKKGKSPKRARVGGRVGGHYIVLSFFLSWKMIVYVVSLSLGLLMIARHHHWFIIALPELELCIPHVLKQSTLCCSQIFKDGPGGFAFLQSLRITQGLLGLVMQFFGIPRCFQPGQTVSNVPFCKLAIHLALIAMSVAVCIKPVQSAVVS